MEQTASIWTDKTIPEESRSALSAACRMLCEARWFAARSGRGPWSYAVELNCLLVAGTTPSVLRWLVQEGLVEHRLERLGPPDRQCRENGLLLFLEGSCFVLLDKGEAFAQALFAADEGLLGSARAARGKGKRSADTERPKPFWEPKSRELWAGESLLYVLPRQAVNRVLLLNSFQEVNWAEWLDNPFPRTKNGAEAKRLKDAVYGLNQCQRGKRLLFRFHTNDDGEGVSWTWLAAPKKSAHHCGQR